MTLILTYLMWEKATAYCKKWIPMEPWIKEMFDNVKEEDFYPEDEGPDFESPKAPDPWKHVSDWTPEDGTEDPMITEMLSDIRDSDLESEYESDYDSDYDSDWDD